MLCSRVMYNFYMSVSSRIGLGFGTTSGIITTLGLITGLALSTESKTAVISGILTIAVADALSDAFGIHVSQESTNKYSDKAIWKATLMTFLAKFFIALTFLVPVLLLDLKAGMYVSFVWGLSLLVALTFSMSKKEHRNPWAASLEHLVIAIFVLAASYLTGTLINTFLG